MRKALSITGWSIVGLSFGLGIFHKVVDLTNPTLYHNSVEWLGNMAAVVMIVGVSLLLIGAPKS